jgi:hypothetical protein
MSTTHLASLSALAVAIAVVSLAPAPIAGQTPATKAPEARDARELKTWTAPRTPWGDPDIAGVFTTDDEMGVPFERPAQFGDRQFVTDGEFSQRQTQAERQADADREEVVVARPAAAEGPTAGGTGPPAHWIERGKPSRRTSLVIDPPDGRIPYLNEDARRRGAAAAGRTTATEYRGPEDLDLYDRCITRGLPHVIFPTIYGNTSQIVQGQGSVSIRYEMIHEARVIPLDGRPHLASNIRLLFGDSRGHWEGDTLVVDVTNFSNTISYRGSAATLHLTERFRRVDANTVHYEVTVDDQTTFARPWTAALNLRNDPRQPQVYEYACHEGNYAMFNILSGARADEKAASK